MTATSDLTGKVAIVTGSSRGMTGQTMVTDGGVTA